MKEHPKKMHQSSVERRNAKTNPVRKTSQGDHRHVANLVMIVVLGLACFTHDRFAPFGDDATMIFTKELMRKSWGL